MFTVQFFKRDAHSHASSQMFLDPISKEELLNWRESRRTTPKYQIPKQNKNKRGADANKELTHQQ